MSGGPPGRRGRAPRRLQQSGDGCDLHLTVDLVGVRREAADRVRAGDDLGVDLVHEGGAVGAVCRNDEGAVVGALAAFPGLTRLLDCLAREVPFVAHVEEVSSTRCVVTVSRTDP